jgi:hypothetical protein
VVDGNGDGVGVVVEVVLSSMVVVVVSMRG